MASEMFGAICPRIANPNGTQYASNCGGRNLETLQNNALLEIVENWKD
jgi:hypothetical protein